jgi:hypothetical protein
MGGFGIVMEGLRLRGGAPRLRKRRAQDDWDEDEGPEQDEDNDLDGQRGEDDEMVRSDEGVQEAVGSDEEQGKVHENEGDTDSDTSSGRTLRWDKILESMEPVRPRPAPRAQQAHALTASHLSGAGCRFRRTIAKRSTRLNGAATSQTGGPQMMTSVLRTPRWAPSLSGLPPAARLPAARTSAGPAPNQTAPPALRQERDLRKVARQLRHMRGRVSQPARAPGFDCMPDLLVIGGHGRERDSALVQSFSAAERRWRTEVCPHAPARACASFSASLCKPLRARARANLPVRPPPSY